MYFRLESAVDPFALSVICYLFLRHLNRGNTRVPTSSNSLLERSEILRADVLVRFSIPRCQQGRGLLMLIKDSHEAVNT
jgi:hypothetical protein